MVLNSPSVLPALSGTARFFLCARLGRTLVGARQDFGTQGAFVDYRQRRDQARADARTAAVTPRWLAHAPGAILARVADSLCNSVHAASETLIDRLAEGQHNHGHDERDDNRQD